jgi:hypothetical protein
LTTTKCRDFATHWCKHHVTPAYSPWVNGLVEGVNKILLHVLKCLCAPQLGEDEADEWDKLPRNWPEHLDEAISAINHRILPNLKFSPKELLLGIAINTPRTESNDATAEPPATEAMIHITYVAQQCLDGYEAVVKHAIICKNAFDARVQAKHSEVTFTKGQLVQVYCSDLDYTFKTKQKLLPKWSSPY